MECRNKETFANNELCVDILVHDDNNKIKSTTTTGEIFSLPKHR